jgi:hypothetical protein
MERGGKDFCSKFARCTIKRTGIYRTNLVNLNSVTEAASNAVYYFIGK